MSLPELPAPDEEVIHVHGRGGDKGPMSRRDLSREVEAGTIARADHFWFSGLDGWRLIGDHPSLLADLGDPPEPGAEPPADDDTICPAPEPSDDDQLDAVFGELVQKSWDHFQAHQRAGHLDEVFLGAVITATLDEGYALIDLTSDGTHHYLRFEDPGDHHRVVCRLTHLTGDLTTARVQGQRARVVMGYGERVRNFTRVWKALQSEWRSGYMTRAEPGTITVDGDVQSQYIYVQLDLYLDIDDYIADDYATDLPRLSRDLGACVHALRKYLRGRFA